MKQNKNLKYFCFGKENILLWFCVVIEGKQTAPAATIAFAILK